MTDLPFRADMARLLSGYSAEVTTPDRKALDTASKLMPPGSRVYIAALPKDVAEDQLDVARRLNELGLRPVPHIVARKLRDRAELDKLVRNLVDFAQVDRALILAGDRDVCEGDFSSSLDILNSGVLEGNGIRRISIACYPEGHPRISDESLDKALMSKLKAAERLGFDVLLVSQLCFDGDVIADYVLRLRERGVKAKIRIGIAGPAKAATLLKYAAICGVGQSLRALHGRGQFAANLLRTQTPETLLETLARRQQSDRSLDLYGVHFFTFASLQRTINWASAFLQLSGERSEAISS